MILPVVSRCWKPSAFANSRQWESWITLPRRSGSSKGSVTAIGHTRWATHGKPTEVNVHPHGLSHGQVVHNGIITNYVKLRSSMATPFLSQTDSEVIVHLFEKCLSEEKDALKVFRAVLDELHGAYAILLISERLPGQIFSARKGGSPLQVGFSEQGCFFASSDAPLVGLCERATYLEDGEWGMATQTALPLFDSAGHTVVPQLSLLPASSLAARKEGFRYFMEKEICEQSNVLAGSYLLERLARVPIQVAIASEFRYREPVLDSGGCSL